METKIKGEKIKEGSIPLSALDENIKPIIPNGYYINKYAVQHDWFEIETENAGIFIDAGIIGTDIAIKFNEYAAQIPNGTKYKEGVPFIIGNYPFDVYAKVEGYKIYIKIDDYDFVNSLDWIYVYTNLNKIPNVFIDNIVTTSSQELSDTDKNQALANLGIADLLEALKPVRLSDEPPIGNVTQEQLDEIGLTEKVINNILNGYTNKICIYANTYCVIRTSNTSNALEFVFADFCFNDGRIDTVTQYRYHKYLDEITIEFEEI